jgi:hypothetical protein
MAVLHIAQLMHVFTRVTLATAVTHHLMRQKIHGQDV